MVCNKPKQPDLNYLNFCTLRHSILFYSKTEEERNKLLGTITNQSIIPNPIELNKVGTIEIEGMAQ
jgi:hypothetical protein